MQKIRETSYAVKAFPGVVAHVVQHVVHDLGVTKDSEWTEARGLAESKLLT